MTFAGIPLPQPTPVYHPVYGVIDSLKAALINYNGIRPLDRTGKPFPVVNTRIVGGEKDTVYFNGEPWSHRTEFKKQVFFMSHPDDGEASTTLKFIQVSYGYINPLNADDREGFGFRTPNAIGRYQNTGLSNSFSAGYELRGSDYTVDVYNVDPAYDNWIEIKAIDAQKRQVSGRFDLHLKIANGRKGSVIVSPIVLPNTIHMHGSFTN